MDVLSQNEFETLICGAKLLEKDRHGPKVYATQDGKAVKLFRVKRWLSSNLFCRYAVRFKRNAEHLAILGIPSLQVEQVGVVPHLDRQLVIYPWLPGASLRHALRNSNPQEALRLMRSMGTALALIHEKGVYFRSMHFGNILINNNDASISLIDILDLSVMRKPLSIPRRKRNFQHMIRYEEDRVRLTEFWNPFKEAYGQWATNANSHALPILDCLLETWHRELVKKIYD
jgi:serine/threonine protein kinase